MVGDEEALFLYASEALLVALLVETGAGATLFKRSRDDLVLPARSAALLFFDELIVIVRKGQSTANIVRGQHKRFTKGNHHFLLFH